MEFQFSEYTKQIESLIKRANIIFSNIGQSFCIDEGQRAMIRLVFAGQYSAGRCVSIYADKI